MRVNYTNKNCARSQPGSRNARVACLEGLTAVAGLRSRNAGSTVIASEAKQSSAAPPFWIALSLRSSQ
jgi:hypothetical protein